MTWNVPLADLDYGPEEDQAVLNVLHSRWLTMGAVTQQFETEFAQMLGVKHALAVSNATVALHMACLVLGVGAGDEVIVPSLTFVATANAARYTGARVRFADITSENDLTISPAAIERLINPRTRAIIVMHYGGYACDLTAIRAIAQNHQLPIIEDAAHVPGGTLEGSALGAWGQVGCFSFFSNKNLATGEGGMFVTQQDDLADHARLLRSHGMTTLTWDRHQGHAHSYDVTALGFNYRIDEIHSALGLCQLHKLQAGNQRRGEITRRYWAGLQDSGVGLPFQNFRGQPSYHIFPMLLPPNLDRDHFIDALKADGIQSSIHYPPIHCFSYYRRDYSDVSLPITEAVARREVTLPIYPAMTDDIVDYVIASVRKNLTRRADK